MRLQTSWIQKRIVLASVLTLTAFGCKDKAGDSDKGPESGRKPGPATEKPGGQAGQGGTLGKGPHQPDAAPNHLAWLDAVHGLELAVTTSHQVAPLPWQEPAPAAQAPAAPTSATAPGQPVQPPVTPRVFNKPAVLIGRGQWFVGARALGPVRCASDSPDLCKAEALRGPTGKVVLDFDPAALQGVLLTALQEPAAAWKGQQVLVFADRRVAWSAVDAVLQTCKAAGAEPVLVAATYDGQLAEVFAKSVAPTAVAAAVAGAGAESNPASAVPEDLSAVRVQVGRSGVSLFLDRKSGEPLQPELLGNVMESLAAWAQRLRATVPSVHAATVEADDKAPLEEIVRVIDALRDSCAKIAKGMPCDKRDAWFDPIDVVRAKAQAAEGAAPAGESPDSPAMPVIGAQPLHFDDPGVGNSGLSLHGSKELLQPNPGLHMDPVQPRLQVPPPASR